MAEDLYRITLDDETVGHKNLVTPRSDGIEHWDGIQIVPRSFPIDPSDTYPQGRIVLPLTWRTQFALADVRDVEVHNCNVVEVGAQRTMQGFPKKGSLQGITCFDGLLRNVTIRDNTISVGSFHEVSLHGVMGGVIRGNDRTIEDVMRPKVSELLTIRLRPAKIGGSPKGLLLSEPEKRCSMYVLSWLAGTYWEDTHEPVEYSPVRLPAGMHIQGGAIAQEHQLVIDERQAMIGQPHDRYLFNFDKPSWNAYMLEQLPKAVVCYGDDVDSFCGWIQQEAAQHGDVVSGDDVWKNHFYGTTPLVREFLLTE